MALRSVDGPAIESPEGFPLVAILAAPGGARVWLWCLVQKISGVSDIGSALRSGKRGSMRQNMGVSNSRNAGRYSNYLISLLHTIPCMGDIITASRQRK